LFLATLNLAYEKADEILLTSDSQQVIINIPDMIERVEAILAMAKGGNDE
jgi:hypothetical protein